MWRLTRGHIQPIGLDIGHDSVKMIQLETGGNSPKVHAWARRVLEAPAATLPLSETEYISPQATEAIRELMRGGEFSGRSIVAALPRQMVHVKNLRLPQMPANELAAVIQFEARNIFPFDADEAQVDFLAAGEVRQGLELRQEVIVLAARRADIDRFAEQLHRTGVVINSLDIELCALYRSVERYVRRRDDEQEVHVLIDLGMKRSQVLIGKGREVSFFKTIDIGGSEFNDAVSKKLGITASEARAVRRRLWAGEESGQRDPVKQAILDATRSTMETLAKEISLCLRYYSVTFRGQRPNRVRLLGGEAADPQLLAILNSVLNVPVEAGRPLFNLNCDGVKGLDRKAPSGEWAMAVGLAMRHTDGRFAPQDGTPRAASAGTPQAAPEVIDLNALIPAPSKESQSQQEHFAAVRRAAVEEKTHA